MEKFTAAVLGGGGSNGDWQAGRLLALKERGMIFDLITGTSVGALNGLAEACDMSSILEQVWTNLTNSRVLTKYPLSATIMQEALSHIGLAKERRSLYKSDPLRRYLDELFLGRKVKTDFFCSVVVVGDNEPNRYMKYHIEKDSEISSTDLDMVWASTAIPVVFEEVIVNNMTLFDGGILQSTPIRQTIRHYPVTDMTAIVCQPFGKMPVKLGKGLFGRVAWTGEAFLRSQFEQEWRELHCWNQAIRQWDLAVPNEYLMIDGMPVRYIEPDLHAPEKELGDLLDFDKSKTAPNFWLGYGSLNDN